MSDLRNRFLSLAGKLQRIKVTVPELGEVTVQELDGGSRAIVEDAMFRRKDGYWRPLLVVLSVWDEDADKPAFTEADVDDLQRLPSRILDPIFHAAFKLSGMGADAAEEAEKN